MSPNGHRLVRIETLIGLIELVLLVALCALAVRWFTIIFAGAPLPVPPAALTNSPSNDRAAEMMASARLFGAHPAGSLSENVQALGVIADTSDTSAGTSADAANGALKKRALNALNSSSALISVDGKPPRAYRIGSDVEGRRLIAIRPDEIEMEGNGTRQVFRLPPRGTPAIGINPAGSSVGSASVVVPGAVAEPGSGPSILGNFPP